MLLLPVEEEERLIIDLLVLLADLLIIDLPADERLIPVFPLADLLITLDRVFALVTVLLLLFVLLYAGRVVILGFVYVGLYVLL